MLSRAIHFRTPINHLVDSVSTEKKQPEIAVQPWPVVVSQASHEAAASLLEADLGIPPALCNGQVYVGPACFAPVVSEQKRSPAVLFLHGSGGLNDSTRSWQRWLAQELHLPSLATNGLAMPGRIRYQSPTTKETYERVHAARAVELKGGIECLRACSWVDPEKIVVAGTSEGAVAVARMEPGVALGRILYAWSCESNYFVEQHGTRFGEQEPVLNVISTDDPYFRPGNPWHGDATGELDGHAAASVKGNLKAVIVLLSGAPHTLYNLSPARHATQAFLSDLFTSPEPSGS